MFEKKFLLSLETNDTSIGYKIYKNNILSNRISALMDLFKGTTLFLGEDFMKQSARHYAQNHAPDSSNLNLYGKEFGAYIASLEACNPFVYLRDMMDFEYKTREIFYAPDYHRITTEDIIAGTTPNKLDPHVTLFQSPYDIYNILQYIFDETLPTPDITSKQFSYLLYRAYDSYEVFVKPVETQDTLSMIASMIEKGLSSVASDLLDIPKNTEMLQFLLAKRLFIQ